MKRLFTIITLIVSSFFLFSINEVRADSHTYELTEDNFSILNDEFYNLREKVIKYVQDNNLHGYIIVYNSSKQYRAYVAHDDYRLSFASNAYSIVLQYSYKLFATMGLDSSGELVVLSEPYNGWLTGDILNQTTILHGYLDSDIPLIYSGSHEYSIVLNDKTYLINNGATAITLYQIYLDNNTPVEPDDPYEEEKNIINNFYSTTIAKIGDLATTFANNYVFILIFGIFILIFVIELIRRYLL